MQRVGRMLGNLIRASAAMLKLHVKDKGSTEMERHECPRGFHSSLCQFLWFRVQHSSFYPKQPNCPASSILSGLAGMLATRFLYNRKIIVSFR